MNDTTEHRSTDLTNYDPAEVPAEARWVTCGVDVQIDRIECEVVAWAPSRESWSMDYRVFYGDPRVGPSVPGSPWHQLDALGKALVEHYGTEPPKPYAIEILGHGHMIGPWNYPLDREV